MNKIIKIGAGVIVTALLMCVFITNQHDAGTNTVGIQLAGEIPEPATSLLLAAGGILMYRRYRRK